MNNKNLSRRESFVDLLTRLAAANGKLRGPNQLSSTVSLPPEFAAALSSGRPEMLKIVRPRALSVDECKALYDAFGVMIETNMLLVQHASAVARLAENIGSNFVGIQRMLNEVECFADFRTVGMDGEEAA